MSDPPEQVGILNNEIEIIYLLRYDFYYKLSLKLITNTKLIALKDNLERNKDTKKIKKIL